MINLDSLLLKNYDLYDLYFVVNNCLISFKIYGNNLSMSCPGSACLPPPFFSFSPTFDLFFSPTFSQVSKSPCSSDVCLVVAFPISVLLHLHTPVHTVSFIHSLPDCCSHCKRQYSTECSVLFNYTFA